METNQLIQIGWLVGCTLVGIWGAALAKRRNRNASKWFFVCWLTGLIGLITLAVSKTLDYDEDTDFQETDLLGNIMLVIGLLLFTVSIYIGFMSAKEAHDAAMMNFMLSF